ncbi:DUF427-domain-containing protein [Daedaleopsis nitida]|nr:DUF427-domain-containing protein [Daedaleopsis nitida]
MKVTLHGTILAESDKTVVVEGNHYFPPDAVKSAVLSGSSTHTTCGWKGVASYYNAAIHGKPQVNDVAWYYPDPKAEANQIKGYIAFYKASESDDLFRVIRG